MGFHIFVENLKMSPAVSFLFPLLFLSLIETDIKNEEGEHPYDYDKK